MCVSLLTIDSSSVALRTVLDDQLPDIFSKRGYTQSFILGDIRMAIGFTASIIAALYGYYDYQNGFIAALPYCRFAVPAFFILNTILTFWMFYVEGNIKYQGINKNGSKITISTEAPKYEPKYIVSIKIENKNGKAKNIKGEIGMNGFFTPQGIVVKESFSEWIAKLLASKKE